MQAKDTSKRVALVSPHAATTLQSPTTQYVVSQMPVTTGGEIRLYDYDKRTARSVLSGTASAIPGLRCIGWLAHPNHNALITAGTLRGDVQILDLQPKVPDYYTPQNSAGFQVSKQSLAGFTSLGTLPIQPNRPVTAITCSSVDPAIVLVGYEKTRNQHSLYLWDLEVSLQAFSAPSHLRPAATSTQRLSTSVDLPAPNNAPIPIQQYLPAEWVTSVVYQPNTNTQAIVATNSKSIKCVDFRAPNGLAKEGETTGTATGTDQSIAFSIATRAVQTLGISNLYPHLIASSEEGLTGTVKIWDTRFLRSSHPIPSTSYYSSSTSTSTQNQTTGEAYSFEFGQGGVMALRWDTDNSGRGGARLGVGTKDGGVGVIDVYSGERSVVGGGAAEGEGRKGRPWTAASGLRVVKPEDQNTLQTFTFLPSNGDGRSKILAVHRDATTSLLSLGSAPEIAHGRQGDSIFSNSLALRAVEPSLVPPCISTHKPQALLGAGATSESTVPLPRGRTRSTRENSRPNMNVRNLSLNQESLNSHSQHDYGGIVDLSITQPATRAQTRQNTSIPWRVAAEDRPDPQTGRRKRSDQSPGTVLPVEAGDMGLKGFDDILGGDIGVMMRRKAGAGFGLDLLANDVIEKSFPITDGFLFEWLDRFVRLMGSPDMHGMDKFDFSLHGICGIWNGHPSLEDHSLPQRSQTTPATTLLSRELDIYAGFTQNRHLHNPHQSRSPATRSGRLTDPAMDKDYIEAMQAIMDEMVDQFPVGDFHTETGKMTHRRFMLAILGELTGGRLENEINRIMKTQLPKAAWIALFNNQKERAMALLRDSANDTHRLMSSFLQQGQIEPSLARAIDISDPYLRAILNYLAGGRNWDNIINDPELPLLERLVLAIRFVDDRTLNQFLESQSQLCDTHGDLHGIPLTGLSSSSSISLLTNYLHRTSDLQTVAVFAAVMPAAITASPPSNSRASAVPSAGGSAAALTLRKDRWIEDYRDLLDGWKLFRQRVSYDIYRGKISRWYAEGRDRDPSSLTNNPLSTPGGSAFTSRKERQVLGMPPAPGRVKGELDRMGQVVVRCNFCAKDLTGPERGGAGIGIGGGRGTVRSTCCPHCGNRLPRCVICLLHIDIKSPEAGGNTLESAFIFCQSCHHGGHYHHIMQWFHGSDYHLHKSRSRNGNGSGRGADADANDSDDDDNSDFGVGVDAGDRVMSGTGKHPRCAVAGCECPCASL